MARKRVRFLSLKNVLAIHKRQIDRYGGLSGIRELGLVESAVLAPKHFHYYKPESSLYDLASVYAYHISKNQGFLDGNKRTAVVCALAFLKLNGGEVLVPQGVLLRLTEQVASGETSRLAFAAYLAAKRL